MVITPFITSRGPPCTYNWCFGPPLHTPRKYLTVGSPDNTALEKEKHLYKPPVFCWFQPFVLGGCNMALVFLNHPPTTKIHPSIRPVSFLCLENRGGRTDLPLTDRRPLDVPRVVRRCLEDELPGLGYVVRSFWMMALDHPRCKNCKMHGGFTYIYSYLEDHPS